MNQNYRSTDFARVSSLSAVRRRADARALAGRHALAILTAEGLTWLIGVVEAMPSRGEIVEVLSPEQGAVFLEPSTGIGRPFTTVVRIERTSPRRGRVDVRAVIDLAPAVVRRPAPRLAVRRAEYRAARGRHDLAAE